MDSDDEMNSLGSSGALDDFEDQDSEVSVEGKLKLSDIREYLLTRHA